MEKRKMIVASVSLLLCFVVLVTSSYAWISLSRAPEITGIATNVGANGSLEVALVSNKTFEDLSLIKSGIGDSAVVQDKTVSNLAWGNVIDLTDESYGLGQISFRPAKINAFLGEDGGKIVNSNLLGFAAYGADGRVERQNMDSVSAVYSQEGFIYDPAAQGHGVRGIGSISNVSPQQAALTAARSFINSYKSSALMETKAVLESDGEALIDLYKKHYYQGEDIYTGAEIQTIKSIMERMRKSFDYVDLSLRQGIIGYGASMVEDQATFNTLRSTVENTSIPLSLIVSAIPTELPSGLSDWITEIDTTRLELQKAATACGYLTGRGATWDQVSQILGILIDPEKVYLGQSKLSKADAYANLSAGHTLTFAPGSGVFGEIADFCGNYDTIFTYKETIAIDVITTSSAEPLITMLSEKLEELEPAGENSEPAATPIQDIYGAAIDIAFRCNEASKLMLQTEAALRYGEATETGENMGSGSFMSFSSDQLDEEDMVELVDAIRVGFVDGCNNLVAIAKLGTSDYEFNEEEKLFTAPLWLYEFELSESGSLIMGERRTEDCTITDLTDDVPIVISAVIWLDGEHVYNSNASISKSSMTGTLNLQFATSAQLIPVDAVVTPVQ